jgi:hypothetical protein
VRVRCSLRPVRLTLAVILSLFALSANIEATRGQTPEGATLTVLSGTVAVLFTNGSTIQPAPSGLTLGVGDRVATVGGPALVTFFEGSELELGPETTIILREIRANGQEVHVSVEDVLGTAVGRVQAFASPNSSYQLQTPGGQTVALIRGSFARITVFETGSTRVAVGDCTHLCEIEYQGKELYKDKGEAAFGITSSGNVTQTTMATSLEQLDPDQEVDEDDDHGDDNHEKAASNSDSGSEEKDDGAKEDNNDGGAKEDNDDGGGAKEDNDDGGGTKEDNDHGGGGKEDNDDGGGGNEGGGHGKGHKK